MILVNGDSFTAGAESTVAWPTLIANTINLARAAASNDYIVRSTVDYIEDRGTITHAIIAWTTPARIEINGYHLTASSHAEHGAIIKEVFQQWNQEWALNKFCNQVHLLGGYLKSKNIPYVFLSTFDLQTQLSGPAPDNYLGWPDQGIIEWMGDCDKGPGGHPLEQGHKRIASKINEHIRNLGWVS